MMLHEFDDEVEAYRAQPLSFCYTTQNGKLARYTPDQLVKKKNQNNYVFREVKPQQRVDDALLAKISWINAHVRRKYNATLEMLTDTEIRVGKRIDNFNHLYPYKRVFIGCDQHASVLSHLPGELLFSDLINFIKRQGISEVVAFAMLAQGMFRFEYTQLLTRETRVFKR